MFRVNQRIRIPRVRVIGADGVQLGILETADALRLAREQGLDLVEVSPKAVPPVCKIMDYGKFKYENSKRESRERANRTVVKIKELKFRPHTDEHDIAYKLKHLREFIQEGNKVRLVVQFRGREIVHPEIGRAMLQRLVDASADIAQLEQAPLMEGKRLQMILGPRAGVVKPAVKVEEKAAVEDRPE